MSDFVLYQAMLSLVIVVLSFFLSALPAGGYSFCEIIFL